MGKSFQPKFIDRNLKPKDQVERTVPNKVSFLNIEFKKTAKEVLKNRLSRSFGMTL